MSEIELTAEDLVAIIQGEDAHIDVKIDPDDPQRVLVRADTPNEVVVVLEEGEPIVQAHRRDGLPARGDQRHIVGSHIEARRPKADPVPDPLAMALAKRHPDHPLARKRAFGRPPAVG